MAEGTISGADLHRFLTEMDVEIGPMRGKTHVALIGDVEVRIPHARTSAVDHSTIRRVAQALGASNNEIREALGRRNVKKGRPKPITAPHQPVDMSRKTSKADVVALAAGLRRLVTQVEQFVREGTHDAAMYERAGDAIAKATRSLYGWPPKVDKEAEAETWERLSPDDSAYKPTVFDPVTTGVARATGVAATVVKRRRTITAWEHGRLS